MFLEEDLLGTPRQRHCKLRGEFRRKYLNHKCWKVPSFDDLFRYLEKTDQLCELDPSLRKDVTANNIHLVLNDMPFPKYPDELYDCVKVSHSQVGILWKTKEYFEKKRSGLVLNKGADKSFMTVVICLLRLKRNNMKQEMKIVSKTKRIKTFLFSKLSLSRLGISIMPRNLSRKRST